jgi:hypothetical protein
MVIKNIIKVQDPDDVILRCKAALVEADIRIY